jgi:hypothetical protein
MEEIIKFSLLTILAVMVAVFIKTIKDNNK